MSAHESHRAARLARNWRRGSTASDRSGLSVVGARHRCLLLLAAPCSGREVVPHPEHVARRRRDCARFRPPSASSWFGTNELGQDVFSLVVAATRVSLLAGLAVVLLGAVVGTVVGGDRRLFRRLVDEVLMRLTDLMLTIPSLILAMAVAAALGPGMVNMVVAIALSWWPGYARLVRGEVMAQEGGDLRPGRARAWRRPARHPAAPHPAEHPLAGDRQDVARHGLRDPDGRLARLHRHRRQAADAGMGHRCSSDRAQLHAGLSGGPAIFPGLAIFLAVFGFNLLGDGLRDVLDPKARR